MTGIYSAGYGAAYAPVAKPEAVEMPSVSNTALPIMAANQMARLWGDPHIVAPNGANSDFQHTGIFNLLSDQDVALNGLLTQKSGGKESYDTEAGLTVGDHQAHFYADGRVELGSATKGMAPASMQDGKHYTLGESATIQRNGDSYTVTTPEYKVKVDTKQDDGNGQKHLNLDIVSGEHGVAADNVKPSGLLGETFNSSTRAQDRLQHAAEAYMLASLFSAPKVTNKQEEKPSVEVDEHEPPAKLSTESASYIWQLADTNNDGKLDATEIQAAARKLQDGNPQHQATAQLMMNMLKGSKAQPKFPDFNGDGRVSLGELSRVASLDGDDTSLSQADLNRLQASAQDKPKPKAGGTGVLSLPQMMLQMLAQSMQVLSQILQVGNLVR
jgi:hypothetical protein